MSPVIKKESMLNLSSATIETAIKSKDFSFPLVSRIENRVTRGVVKRKERNKKKNKKKQREKKKEETSECRSRTRYFVWKKAISSNNLNGEVQ